MKTAWSSGIKDADRKKEIKQAFLAAIVMRKRLIEMLQKKQDSSIKGSRSEDAYESPNWALKQADARGYERALQEVMSLLDQEK